MRTGEVLAYLGGAIDGDGYLKITRSCTIAAHNRPYYTIIVGIQQLWPSEAVALFADTFGGRVTSYPTRDGKQMARCEYRGKVAETVIRRLLPFLLVKGLQAAVVLDAARLKTERPRAPRHLRPNDGRLDVLRQVLLALHEGARPPAMEGVLSVYLSTGIQRMTPEGWGWTREQTFAYLAGIMDSDGSFRTETRRIPEMLGLHYRISLRCAQVVPSPAVELLAKTFGGWRSVKKSRRAEHRHLDFWSVYDRRAVSAIRSLLPHIRVKWREAMLLLELRALKAQGKKGLTEWVHANRWHPSVVMRKRCYTPEQVAEFERIHREVQALHQGVAVAASPEPASG